MSQFSPENIDIDACRRLLESAYWQAIPISIVEDVGAHNIASFYDGNVTDSECLEWLEKILIKGLHLSYYTSTKGKVSPCLR